MKKHPLAQFGLWVLYLALMWGFAVLSASIFDFDADTVMLYFVAGVVCYLSVRETLRS